MKLFSFFCAVMFSMFLGAELTKAAEPEDGQEFRFMRRAIQTSTSEFIGYEIGLRAQEGKRFQVYGQDDLVLDTANHYDKKIPSRDSYLYFVKAAGFLNQRSFRVVHNDLEYHVELPQFVQNKFPSIDKKGLDNRLYKWSIPSELQSFESATIHAWVGHNYTGEQYLWDYSDEFDFIELSEDKKRSNEAEFKKLPKASDHIDYFLSVEVQHLYKVGDVQVMDLYHSYEEFK